jgi:hypothetical protein
MIAVLRPICLCKLRTCVLKLKVFPWFGGNASTDSLSMDLSPHIVTTLLPWSGGNASFP